ncbi:hypothetical protein LOTGIDRAFT_73684, partial [Lottia gigantea]
KKFAKFLFSHVGLCGMVVLYCVAGGFIFEHLEKNNEQMICYESRSEYNPMENKTIESILKIFNDYGFPTENNRALMEVQVKSVLETFRNNTLAIGYDGRVCGTYGEPGGPVYAWSWAGSVMFSVTVISTIGFGHIAPKTVWGRLVCIAYAVLGIPLMLLCLANIGDVLADIFRFIYAKICYTNDTTKLKLSSRSPSPLAKSSVKIVPLDVKTMNRPDPMILDDDSDDDDDDLDEKKITVPLTITMIVIGGYIFGGAVLFALWEGWDWLQSGYFCFITLSTIGFGDVVPGTDFDNPQSQAQLLLGAVYVLFGMAILSMCFSLMQDEIIAKCRWVGQKL